MNEIQTQLEQIRQAIQTQESLRGTLPIKQVETILDALHQQEAALQAQLEGSGAVAQGPGATALGERAAQVERAEVVITGDNNSVQHIIYQYGSQGGPPPDSEALGKQIGNYLIWLLDWAGTLELRGIQRQGEQVVQLDLETVYVPLAATVYRQLHEPKRPGAKLPASPGRRTSLLVSETADIRGDELQQDVNLAEILRLDHRLILTGGPGCGKTTVLLHIAWALARAIADDDPGLAGEKVGFPAGQPLPLPLFIPLTVYAAHCRGLKRGADRTLATFISQYLFDRQTSFELPDDFFRLLLRQGRAIILLLDGLDEVPDESERAQVRQAIEDLVTGREGLRVVVTCRTAAYQGRTALGKGFRQVVVRPLAAKHVADLIGQAYAHLYRHDPALWQKKTAELLAGIERLESERQKRLGQDTPQLIDSPLLVRMLLIVHYRERRLPEQRAELYMKATDAMLLPDYAPDEEIATEIGQLVGGSWEVHRDLVQHLAFHMHSRGEQQGREISEDELRRLLVQEAAYAPLVDDFIALTRLRGTVLEERLGMYRFLHLAFQEYLAARYLAEIVRGEGGVKAIVAFLESGPVVESWWREVALLVAGYFSVSSPQTAELFLQRLAGIDKEAAARHQALPVGVQMAAAEIAAVALLEWQAQRETLQQKMVTRLHALFTDKVVMEQVNAGQRVAVGRALARLGDPRPEMVTVDGMRFCFVPVGPFWMGSDKGDPLARDNEKPLHQVDLPYNYWIGQYPVTNDQFGEFVADGGYKEAGYWVEAEELGYWQDGRFKGPWDNDFRDAQEDFGEPFTLPNHPVVGVSWYESLAFSRWLTERWRKSDYLPVKWEIRLPSEAEWEKAARGGLRIPAQNQVGGTADFGTLPATNLVMNPNEKRHFPWGTEAKLDKYETGRCNDSAASIGATSALGAFPGDRSPYDLLEVSGNVFEWTRSKNVPYKYQLDERERPDVSDDTRVLRGGGWGANEVWRRYASRNWNDPASGFNDLGFRVVVSPFSPSGL